MDLIIKKILHQEEMSKVAVSTEYIETTGQTAKKNHKVASSLGRLIKNFFSNESMFS